MHNEGETYFDTSSWAPGQDPFSTLIQVHLYVQTSSFSESGYKLPLGETPTSLGHFLNSHGNLRYYIAPRDGDKPVVYVSIAAVNRLDEMLVDTNQVNQLGRIDGFIFVWMTSSKLCHEAPLHEDLRKYVRDELGYERPVAFICWWDGFAESNFTRSSLDSLEDVLQQMVHAEKARYTGDIIDDIDALRDNDRHTAASVSHAMHLLSEEFQIAGKSREYEECAHDLRSCQKKSLDEEIACRALSTSSGVRRMLWPRTRDSDAVLRNDYYWSLIAKPAHEHHKAGSWSHGNLEDSSIKHVLRELWIASVDAETSVNSTYACSGPTEHDNVVGIGLASQDKCSPNLPSAINWKGSFYQIDGGELRDLIITALNAIGGPEITSTTLTWSNHGSIFHLLISQHARWVWNASGCEHCKRKGRIAKTISEVQDSLIKAASRIGTDDSADCNVTRKFTSFNNVFLRFD